MKYKVIYADPPWRFSNKRTGGSMKSGAGSQYQTMTMAQLISLDIPSICDEDCALVMWWVSSQPQEALDLCRAWGFTVKNANGFVWNKTTKNGKPHFGMGFWTRAGSESALIAVRGKPQKFSHPVRAVRTSPVTRHSEKPSEFRDDIVELFGDVPRLEMFARTKVPGWDVYGNEVEGSIEIPKRMIV